MVMTDGGSGVASRDREQLDRDEPQRPPAADGNQKDGDGMSKTPCAHLAARGFACPPLWTPAASDAPACDRAEGHARAVVGAKLEGAR
jgi:hypothetical protein